MIMMGRNRAAGAVIVVALRTLDRTMTIDLFAASFICRDAEMGAIFDAGLVKSRSGLGSFWAGAKAFLSGLVRRSSLA